MAAVTLTIEPDELLGLSALATLDKAEGDDTGSGTGAEADVVSTAKTLMDTALADRLTEAGLPWAPSAEAVRQRAATATPARARSKTLRRDSAVVLAVAVLVVLWGGYAREWKWTGFQANGQLWDWLNLLLLPTVIAVIPLWVQYKRYIGRARTVVYGAVIVAWTAFVIAGYLIPIGWTGFRGQTLWNWFVLLLIPLAVAITMTLTSMQVQPTAAVRSLRPYQKAIVAALAAGWAVTVIGGYALRWAWTGYTGNTLWDWLELLLVPLLFPTVLLPALLKWVTGDASGRAAQPPAVTAPAAAPEGRASP